MRRVVFKPVGGDPAVVDLDARPGRDHDRLGRLVGGPLEAMPVSARLAVFFDEAGLPKRRPPNCRGLVSPVVVARVGPDGTVLGMTDGDEAEARAWLRDGRPDPRTPAAAGVVGFPLPAHARTAPEMGAAWEPQAHFTGMATDLAEVALVDGLVRRYADRIVAHHLYSPLPGVYSLELQFADPGSARACIREHEAGPLTPRGTAERRRGRGKGRGR